MSVIDYQVECARLRRALDQAANAELDGGERDKALVGCPWCWIARAPGATYYEPTTTPEKHYPTCPIGNALSASPAPAPAETPDYRGALRQIASHACQRRHTGTGYTRVSNCGGCVTCIARNALVASYATTPSAEPATPAAPLSPETLAQVATLLEMYERKCFESAGTGDPTWLKIHELNVRVSPILRAAADRAKGGG